MTEDELKNYIPEYTEEGNIVIADETIMFANEEVYIKESIRQICQRIRPRKVIELGYGLGYTTQQFQDNGVEKHIIIEPNKFLYNKAVEWARGKRGITVINDRWQNARVEGEFDFLYDDTFELVETDYPKDFARFNFMWFAPFCGDYAGAIPPHHFRFKIDEYDKIQMLIKADDIQELTAEEMSGVREGGK